jgi:hypothetical protein
MGWGSNKFNKNRLLFYQKRLGNQENTPQAWASPALASS